MEVAIQSLVGEPRLPTIGLKGALHGFKQPCTVFLGPTKSFLTRFKEGEHNVASPPWFVFVF